MKRFILLCVAILVTALLFSGCSSSTQYSPSKGKEITSAPTTQKTTSLVQSYSNLIGRTFNQPYMSEIKVTIKGFDITYEKKQDVNKAHLLFLVENTGKTVGGVSCASFALVDKEGREFELEDEGSNYYSDQDTGYAGTIQPGLSAIMGCAQVFPKNAELKQLSAQNVYHGPTVILNLTETGGSASETEVSRCGNGICEKGEYAVCQNDCPIPDLGKTVKMFQFSINLTGFTKEETNWMMAESADEETYCAIFTVRNDGNNTEREPLVERLCNIYDSGGVRHEYLFTNPRQDELDYKDLEPGEATSGSICFTQPSTYLPKTLKCKNKRLVGYTYQNQTVTWNLSPDTAPS